MSNKNQLYLFIVFFSCIISRILTSIFYIEDTDSLRFAFSLTDYDLGKLQPHFPGYPVFCFFAKILYLITNSMGLTFSLIGGLSIFFIIYYMLRLDHNEIDSKVGMFVVFIIFFNPLFWLMSNRYMPDLMGLALLTIILYQLIRRSDNLRSLYIGYFLSGLLAGTRLSYLPILIIPFFNQLMKNKNRLKLISSFGLGVFVWLIPLIWITGLDKLWVLATNQTYGHFMDFGGSIITDNSLTTRFSNLFESIWADGLGGYWAGRSLDTAIFSFFLAFLSFIGIKTITEVRVAAITGVETSFVPFTAASLDDKPSSLCRCIFSKTTTLLSTSIPTASISPLREIIFREKSTPPILLIKKTTVKVATTETGIATAIRNVALNLNKNMYRTIIASPAPIIPELRKLIRLVIISAD